MTKGFKITCAPGNIQDRTEGKEEMEEAFLSVRGKKWAYRIRRIRRSCPGRRKVSSKEFADLEYQLQTTRTTARMRRILLICSGRGQMMKSLPSLIHYMVRRNVGASTLKRLLVGLVEVLLFLLLHDGLEFIIRFVFDKCIRIIRALVQVACDCCLWSEDIWMAFVQLLRIFRIRHRLFSL